MKEIDYFEIARTLLDYDSKTGGFKWKHRKTNNKGAGHLNKKGYLMFKINGRNIRGHRIAWYLFYGIAPENQIDHINGIKNDNRICNLRIATHGENIANRGLSRNNTSGKKGVYWDKSINKWRADIKANNQRFHLGCFNDVNDAANAYDEAAIKLHKEFAFINSEQEAKQ